MDIVLHFLTYVWYHNTLTAILHVHVKFFFLCHHIVVWVLRLINYMIELIDFMVQRFLRDLTRSCSSHYMDSEINPTSHFIKVQFAD